MKKCQEMRGKGLGICFLVLANKIIFLPIGNASPKIVKGV
jgi:hypothetical protein